jgi:hypothetical protein
MYNTNGVVSAEDEPRHRYEGLFVYREKIDVEGRTAWVRCSQTVIPAHLEYGPPKLDRK